MEGGAAERWCFGELVASVSAITGIRRSDVYLARIRIAVTIFRPMKRGAYE